MAENETKVVEAVKETTAPEATNETPNRERGNRRPRGNRNFKRRERRIEPKEYEERVVAINRVCKTVKGGRRMKFSALVVIGNGKGKYGFGLGKSSEVPDAIKKSVDKAKKNTFRVQMVNAGTIAHDVVGHFGATKVFLKPAPEGTGIIAGGPVRAILELSGVRNVYSKVYGSRTPINIIRATNAALNDLKSYKQVKALRSKEVTEDVK